MELKWSGGIVEVLEGLFIFGIVYNAMVGWMERDGRDRGYTAFLVVLGVLVTLGGFAVLSGLEHVLLCLLCFIASGTPMVVGSMWRYSQERCRAAASAKDCAAEALDD